MNIKTILLAVAGLCSAIAVFSQNIPEGFQAVSVNGTEIFSYEPDTDDPTLEFPLFVVVSPDESLMQAVVEYTKNNDFPAFIIYSPTPMPATFLNEYLSERPIAPELVTLVTTDGNYAPEGYPIRIVVEPDAELDNYLRL